MTREVDVTVFLALVFGTGLAHHVPDIFGLGATEGMGGVDLLFRHLENHGHEGKQLLQDVVSNKVHDLVRLF